MMPREVMMLLWRHAVETGNEDLLRLIPIYSPCAFPVLQAKQGFPPIEWRNGRSDDSWLPWQRVSGYRVPPRPMLHQIDGDSEDGGAYMGDSYQIARVGRPRRNVEK